MAWPVASVAGREFEALGSRQGKGRESGLCCVLSYTSVCARAPPCGAQTRAKGLARSVFQASGALSPWATWSRGKSARVAGLAHGMPHLT